MTPLEWNEIEQELENTPTPQPPADLLSKIQAEIPSGAELAAEGEVPPTAAAKPHKSPSRRRWLMAASALIAVSASFLAYRVGQEDPSREGFTVLASPRTDNQHRDEQRELLEASGYLSSGNELEPAGRRKEKAPEPLIEADGAQQRREISTNLKAIKRQQPTKPVAPRPDRARAASQAAPADAMRAAPRPTENTREAKPTPTAPAVEMDHTTAAVTSTTREVFEALGYSGSSAAVVAPNDAPYEDVYFKGYGTNPFIDTEDDPLSTFGLDVDSGSYSVSRLFLGNGRLPPADAIRVEEFINYFDYRDAPPRAGDFALTAEAAPSLFGGGPRHHLVRFNVAGRTVSDRNRTPATLVFVIDVSGSMQREGRLELVKKSLGILLDELRPDDRVGLVIYGSRAQVLLEPTSDHRRIRNGIQQLQPGGSTNAEEGLLAAYQLLANHRAGAFDRDRDDRFAEDDRPSPGLSGMPKRERIYRIILCSDGVANVGNTGPKSILERIGEEAQTGIALTTVGFGMGNYNDVLMEQLADRGDGAYAYVDTLLEAKRIFVENLTGTLQTIASDAKIQVEFDPKTVSRYRLLGYENRAIADEDFRNDKVDAGEVGAGHTVTALYEIKLHPDVKPRGEIAKVNLRYRSKANGQIEETSTKIRVREIEESWNDASPALRLTSIVAEFAELLKGSYWTEGSSFQEVLTHAQRVSAEYAGDPEVAELVALIGAASRLSPEKR